MKPFKTIPLQKLGMVLLTIALLCPAVAKASILYQFNTPFSGDPDPAGKGPWIDASFVDVTPGTVLLTITNVNLTSGEFVQGNGNGASGGLFFNLNTNDNPTALDFTLVASNGDFGPIISTGENAFKADGDGDYDIQFDFSNQLFSTDSSITYKITGISGLTAADFAYLSNPDGGLGPFYAAAKVMGLSGGGGGSTFLEPSQGAQILSVPEPSPSVILLSGIGLFGVGQLWFRRTKV